ncbi:heavy metal-associated domain-containing protein [Carnobacterium sp. ISL-102]|uniref:heavy-metal-associated domain-containing protein n=1 Tax=Carnobacterium sp. ISL-102 TaxID=2819142 RepID=UPI001BE718DC|nr:heavy metal-associated domain-containing protein [Carnobacterium sp. ISL-102]MBT2731924.1 heavy-metal-associated domain-containing protein [Carnobacterium sp. ISL-102]
MKKELTIEGMKCGGCASTVVEKLQSIEGIERVVVDLEKKQAIVESQNEIDEKVFIQALSDTNYNLVK